MKWVWIGAAVLFAVAAAAVFFAFQRPDFVAGLAAAAVGAAVKASWPYLSRLLKPSPLSISERDKRELERLWRRGGR